MGLMENKIAVITGGNSGIGEASAKLFAGEGATVVITARRESELKRVADEINAAGGNAFYIPGDMSVRADVERVIDTTVQKYGRIDVMMANAGILDYHCSIDTCDSEMWDNVIGINQNAVFYCCRASLKYMEAQGAGSIVVVSSVAGVSGNAGFSYTASKFAVVGLAKNIAFQYTGTDIRCNVICPGPAKTPMNAEPTPEKLAQMEKYADKEFQEKSWRQADGSMGMSTAEDQAKAALFFASDLSSAVTGQVLLVDRGFYIEP